MYPFLLTSLKHDGRRVLDLVDGNFVADEGSNIVDPIPAQQRLELCLRNAVVLTESLLVVQD